MEEIKSVINMCYHEKYDVEELNNRRLYINYGIDETVVDTICFHIMRYNREDIGKTKEEARTIIDEYYKMIDGQAYDEELLEEAVAFQNVGKQANRIKCATIGWKGFEELLNESEKCHE